MTLSSRPARRPFTAVLLASLWMATLGNLALWRALRQLGVLDTPAGWGLAAGLVAMIAGALVALLGLLAWRHTLKPVTTLLLLATAAASFFMLSYSIVLDPTMVVNVLQTDVREARDLMSGRFFAALGVLAVLPAWLLWRTPLDFGRLGARLRGNALMAVGGLLVVVVAAVACFQPLASTMRNHKHVRYLINPLNALYAVGWVAAAPLRHGAQPLQPIGEDAALGASYRAQPRPPLVVLVLGETGRAGNFALNGYPRPTTPELAKAGVVSFRNAWSCGTSTAASVPCMFSHLGREAFTGTDQRYETVLDVLRRAGLAVLWVDNQSGCKGVCDRVPNVLTRDTADPVLCPGGECHDEILLKHLDARLEALDAERRARGVVLVLHTMGSHGPAYHQRTPKAFKRFLPECESNALQACSRESVVNAYDNTIAYTDHVLAETIRWLQARASRWDGAMLYVADHGESLGENNLYLHGLPYAIAPDVQKHVPWITWLSDGFAARQRLSAECLRGRLDARISHDHLFHSLLGLADVKTGVYQPALDAYAACRGR